jgi:hypothetical protein
MVSSAMGGCSHHGPGNLVPEGVEGLDFLPLKNLQITKIAGGRLIRRPAIEMMASVDIAIAIRERDPWPQSPQRIQI